MNAWQTTLRRVCVAGLWCLAMAAVPAQAAPTYWSGSGHWYEPVYVGTSGITWTAARDAAVAKGGYLACITLAAENDFVYGLISDDTFWNLGWGYGPWLGGYQYDKLAEPAGHWAWLSPEPWGYTNWQSGQPDDWRGAEDRLHFFNSGGGKSQMWNDQSDVPFAEVYGYVVEYVPEPSVLVLLGMGAVTLLLYAWRRRRG